MRVILKEAVPKLGHLGDCVTVKDGFARNWLLPRGLAILATTANLAQIEAQKRRRQKEEERRKHEALALAERLKKLSCTIRVRVGEQEKLFGAVTAQDITHALAQEGVTIDRQTIQLAEPIHALGVYAVPIKVHPEVSVSVKVWVVRA